MPGDPVSPQVRIRPFPDWPRPPTGLATRVERLIASGHWWQSGGGEAEELESWLCAQHGAVAAVAVANGTTALEVALRGLGIGPGDEVLVPAATFISTASAVTMVGATPVPVDVLPDTWCLDTSKAGAEVTSRTRALIVVHLAGQAADLGAAREFCDSRSLALIEDSAQATTACWRDSRVGTVGDITTMSFQAAKLLPGGDGGAVIIKSDSQLARRIELLANCGRPRGSGSYDFEIVGTNARINEFAAAVILAHVAEYADLWKARVANADALTWQLASIDPAIVLRVPKAVTRHDWYMYMLRTPVRWREAGLGNRPFVHALQDAGIPAAVMYPAWQTTRAYGASAERTPVAEQAGKTGVWLHHRLLLDEDGPADIALAVGTILENLPDLQQNAE